MLIKRVHLDAIVRGDVTLAFRRQKRPTVKAGGTLKTVVGVLAIDAVDRVTMSAITERQAHMAGFESKRNLVSELRKRDGPVYRIALRYEGADPRIALRNSANITAAEREEIQSRLERYDRFSKLGPWTDRALRIIAKSPAVRAPDLAAELGYETKWFKTNVRKLKALGLTESLKVGYRLSPRGRAFLRG